MSFVVPCAQGQHSLPPHNSGPCTFISYSPCRSMLSYIPLQGKWAFVKMNCRGNKPPGEAAGPLSCMAAELGEREDAGSQQKKLHIMPEFISVH